MHADGGDCVYQTTIEWWLVIILNRTKTVQQTGGRASLPPCLLFVRNIVSGLHTRTKLSFSSSSVQAIIKSSSRNHSATKQNGLKYKMIESEMRIIAHYNAECAEWNKTKQYTTSVIIVVKGMPIIWYSTCQSIVAFLCAEAEQILLSTTVKDVSWIRRICWKAPFKCPYGNFSSLPIITIYTNGTAAISINTQDGRSARTKHTKAMLHYIKNLLSDFVSGNE